MDFLRLTKKDHLPTWCDLTERPESEGGDRQRRGLWSCGERLSTALGGRENKNKQEEGEEKGRARVGGVRG